MGMFAMPTGHLSWVIDHSDFNNLRFEAGNEADNL